MLSGSSARLAVLVLFVALWHAAVADARTGTVKLLVQSSPLAGFRYYAASSLWTELKAGDVLQLQHERDNPFDPNAVAVSWRGEKLGYVPRRENAAIAWALDRGERLHARISRLREHPNPARRIEFEIYIE